MSGTIHRRVAALEARHRPAPSYVVELSDEALADPVAVQAAIAENQRLTGWAWPVILAPVEATVEEWGVRYGQVAG